MKRFLLVCVSLFFLTLSFHLGTNVVQSQAPTPTSPPSPVVGITADGSILYVVLENGDVFYSARHRNEDEGNRVWSKLPNIFGVMKTEQ